MIRHNFRLFCSCFLSHLFSISIFFGMLLNIWECFMNFFSLSRKSTKIAIACNFFPIWIIVSIEYIQEKKEHKLCSGNNLFPFSKSDVKTLSKIWLTKYFVLSSMYLWLEWLAGTWLSIVSIEWIKCFTRSGSHTWSFNTGISIDCAWNACQIYI